jgi:hypothetical protein
MNRTPRLALVVALAAPISLAFAQSTPAPAVVPAAAPGASIQRVVDQISAQGYRDIREVERKSDKLYEVKARDESGQWVELYVDARSGEILKREVKRRGDR